LIGQTLSHYEILALLGKGGMGEVYRARDTKLGREVALKILPDDVAQDPERIARFEREARTLASLSHANIAALHGLEEAEGRQFLVMELAAGEDLAARIDRGPIPVDEAVQIAGQIAEGLEEAHERGIVHRDLKPANVKVGPEGKVKILDFGLARAFVDDRPDDANIHTSPTITAAMTQAGIILGTAAYMSPEQARGKAVDKRADIWAFGVILFEMLGAEQLFAGETVTDVHAAVVTRDPDFETLPAETPPLVRQLLQRCLQRDPRKRLRDIGEARLILTGELGAVLDAPEPTAVATSEPGPRPRFAQTLLRGLPWLLVLLLGLFVVLQRSAGPDSRRRPLRKHVIEADLFRLYNTRGFEISPDGTRIVYQDRGGLWIRDLDAIEPRNIVGPDGLDVGETGVTPSWSPDGQSILYGARGRVWRVSAEGGNPVSICAVPGEWNGGAWLGPDWIAFGTTRGPMYRVPARGGDPEVLLPLQDGELDFHQPSALPDGSGLLYSVHRAEGVDTLEMWREGQRTVVLRIEPAPNEIRESPQVVNNPTYSPTGHVLYQRDQGNRGLWAIPFSLQRGETTGPSFLVASSYGFPSVSQDGTLLYSELTGVREGQLVLISTEGSFERTLGDPLPDLGSPRFSPDGTKIIFVASERQSRDIFVYDLERDLSSRLTSTPEPERNVVWIPGTDRIAFTQPTADCNAVFEMNADGTGSAQMVAAGAAEPTFLAGGSELVHTTQCDSRRGLNRVIMGQPDPIPLIDDPAGIDAAELSPDGRLLAYRAWESGEATVYVSLYPSMDGKWFLGASESNTRWASDGSQIYYIDTLSYKLIATPVGPGETFRPGNPRELFDVDALGVSPYESFDVAPDGQSFVMVRGRDAGGRGERRIIVVENWIAEFR
jgi:serine/threonine-protein kinase